MRYFVTLEVMRFAIRDRENLLSKSRGYANLPNLEAPVPRPVIPYPAPQNLSVLAVPEYPSKQYFASSNKPDSIISTPIAILE